MVASSLRRGGNGSICPSSHICGSNITSVIPNSPPIFLWALITAFPLKYKTFLMKDTVQNQSWRGVILHCSGLSPFCSSYKKEEERHGNRTALCCELRPPQPDFTYLSCVFPFFEEKKGRSPEWCGIILREIYVMSPQLLLGQWARGRRMGDGP